MNIYDYVSIKYGFKLEINEILLFYCFVESQVP